jgi:hypothetical protein
VSGKELLLARKELLTLRAQMQRMELTAHIDHARENLSWARLLGGSLRGFFRRPGIAAVANTMTHLFKDHPMLATAGSLVFARLRKPLFRVGAKLAIAGAAAVAVYVWIRKDSIAARREQVRS